MQGGRVNHSWCMCVVLNAHGGMGGNRDGDGGWYVCGTKPGGSRMTGDAGALPEYKVIQCYLLVYTHCLNTYQLESKKCSAHIAT